MYIYYMRLQLTDLPLANIFQIIGNIVDHLLGEIFKFRSFHIDLINIRSKNGKIIQNVV